MKQVVRKGFRDIILEEVPEPVASPHHVLIRPVFSLISSGTETASIHQEAVIREVAEDPSQLRVIWEVMKVSDPIRTISEVRAKFDALAALGYSGAGIVVDMHETVRDLSIGERVAYGGEGTGHAETIITGRNLVARVPDGVPFEHACFTTLGAIAMNAVRIANIGLGETVAVIGQGIVGQLISQLVRIQGGIAVAIDLLQDRIDLARELGADHALLGGDSLLDSVRSLTDGRGADCVIIAAAAKSSAPCRQAVQICRDRGRLVNVGAVQLDFPYGDMYMKEIRLFMSRAYGPGSYDELYEKHGRDYPVAYVRWTENRNMEEFLRQIETGAVRIEPLITHRFPLEEAPRAYETILDPKAGSVAVLLRYPAADDPTPRARPEPTHRIETRPGPPPAAAIRVALAGAGNIARWAHLPALKKVRDAELRAVYSSSGVRGKTYAKRFGAAYCCTDYDELLGDADIDVIMIVSRHQHHFAQALAALRAGKHVFIEKPMALAEDECRELGRAVDETGRRLAVGFNRRFAPHYVALKRHLDRRTGPAVLHCRINSPGLSGSFWGADPAFGGAVLGEGVHFVDLMYWLLSSEPVGVSAFSLPIGPNEPIGQNNITACFRFADGSIGNLTYCTVGSRTSGGERVEAFTQGGTFIAQDFKRLEIRTGVSRTTKRMFPAKGYDAQMRSFLASIRAGEQTEVTVVDGARATIGALRMLESARTQTPLSIDVAAALR